VCPDKTCRNEAARGIDAWMAYGMNVMEICCWSWMGMSGRNVFVDTSPKSESCGERGMAVMCGDGRLCKAGMDWFLCSYVLCFFGFWFHVLILFTKWDVYILFIYCICLGTFNVMWHLLRICANLCRLHVIFVLDKHSHIIRRSLPFQGPKISRFQGPPLQTALVMDFPSSKSIRPAPYKQQVH
jgi:hypothetical protein